MKSKPKEQPERVPLTSLQAGQMVEVEPAMQGYIAKYLGKTLKPRHVTVMSQPSSGGFLEQQKLYVNLRYWHPKYHREQSSNFVFPPDLQVKLAKPVVVAARERRLENAKRLRPLSTMYETPNTTSVDIKIGADPEVFVVSDVTKMVIPAWEFLPSKKEPLQVDGYSLPLGEKDPKTQLYKEYIPHTGASSGKRYWDGFQAEFTYDPRACLQEMTDRLHYGLKDVFYVAKARVPHLKPKLTPLSVVQIAEETMQGLSQEQIELGCSPSVNVYGLEAEKPIARMLYERFAGGHMHFGLLFYVPGQKSVIKLATDREMQRQITEMLDVFSGLIGVSLAAILDNPIRRKYYGLPGEIRLPNHGLEYRVNSNFWLCHPAIAHMFWDISRAGLRLGAAGWKKYLDLPRQEEVVQAIQETDVKLARKLLEPMKPMLLNIYRDIHSQWGTDQARPMAEMAVRTIMNGVESAIDDPYDMEKNWLLTEQDNRDGSWRTVSAGRNAQWLSVYQALKAGKKV